VDGANWIGLGTLLTAVLGVCFVGWQLGEQRRAMRAEFGNLYIQRYWSIDDDLMLADKNSPVHAQHRHRYLRLFEDEFDVASLGFLDKKQWRAWHSVLDSHKMLARLEDDLAVCNPDGDEFDRLRSCLAQRKREDEPHDVSRCLGA